MILKVALKWLKIEYVVVPCLYFGKFSLNLGRHNFRDVTSLVKFRTCQTNFKIRAGTGVFKKSCSTSRFCADGCPFLSKKHAQKTTNKNKKNCRFATKAQKLPKSKVGERATFASHQTSPAIEASQAKLVSREIAG